MPSEPYTYRVSIPVGVTAQARLPHDDPFTQFSLRDSLGEETDTSWPTDRVSTRSINTSLSVVLCLGDFERCPLQRTTPVYTSIDVDRTRSSRTDDRVDLAALLSAVDAETDPIRPRECRGGVLVPDANTQTFTETPDAFVDDCTAACAWVDSLVARGVGGLEHQRVRAAVSWPTHMGQFHLDYEYHSQGDDEWGESVRFGFLLSNPVLNPTPYVEFFDEVGVSPPTRQRAWPKQEVILTIAAGEPPLTVYSMVEYVDGEYTKLPVVASNPAYGVDWVDVVARTRRGVSVGREGRPASWSALQRVDSLRYVCEGSVEETQEVRVKQIRVVCSPWYTTIWVTGEVERVW